MTASMPATAPKPADTTTVANVTDEVEREGLDPERVALYVKHSNGRQFVLLLDEVDSDGDLVFTLGAEV